jgi:hypothetical protein
MWWPGVPVGVVALALLNLRGTLRIWRSGVYERGQLVAQTALIWLIPGAVFLVLGVLKSGSASPSSDPTAKNPEAPNPNIWAGVDRPGAP